MSKNISKTSLNNYLKANKINNDNIIKLEYGIDGKNTFTVELRKELDMEQKSKFISIVADTLFSDGMYRPEFKKDLIKIAFFQCYVINIEEPIIPGTDYDLDTNRVIEIVDGLNLIERYNDEIGKNYYDSDMILNIEDKIDYNMKLAHANAIGNIIFEKAITIGYGLSDKLQDIINNIDTSELENLINNINIENINKLSNDSDIEEEK